MGRIVGIDLGTTNSAVAYWNGSEAEIIPNDRGSRITPSVVALGEEGDFLVGESALNQAVIYPEHTVIGVKRRMGSSHRYELRGTQLSPEEISAVIIRELRRHAEEYLGESIHEAVITVPAYFSEKQRRATIEAGRMAGLRVRRILNEPTAAALAYASREKSYRNILVYDLGGGTFDVTCLQQAGANFQVLSTAGDSKLGGMDFSRLLLKQVTESFAEGSGLILADPVIQQQLFEMIERGKIELSSREKTNIGFPFIGSDGKPVHLKQIINRTDFNALIIDLVERSLDLTAAALSEAKLAPDEIDSLVLSGGSSRIPLVRQLLQQQIGCTHVSQVNPDEIVALGAAIQASLLSEQRDMFFRDVTAFDLGVEIEEGRFAPIVRRNTPLPANAQRVFTTVSDDQTAVELHVLQGIGDHIDENTSLGRFLLSGIHRGQRGAARIRVSFSVDVDGLVTVQAADADTGVKETVTLSGNTDASSAKQPSIRSRVQALTQRLESGCRQFKHELDDAFIQEARELCTLARRSVLQQNSEAILQVQSALETLLIEIHALGGISDGAAN